MAGPAPVVISQRDRPQATVLLVACDDDLVELLRVVLERARIAALVARDTAEALQLLLVHQPEAVVVDVETRGGYQFEFLQAIRGRHCVLALACDGVEFEFARSDWVPKPLSPRDLLGRLEPLVHHGGPRRGTDGWTLHELAQGRIPVTGKPAVQLVVSYRTRGGDLAWTGPPGEDALADLALGCARRVAGVAERLTHLELIADVSSVQLATGSPESIDITALALAAGLDEKQLTQQILAEASGLVSEVPLAGAVHVRVVASQVAAPLDPDGQERGSESRQGVPPARVGHGPTQRLLPSRLRALPVGVFVVAVVAAGIAAYMAIPPIVGREGAISGSGVAATLVATLATTAVAQPIAAAAGPISGTLAAPQPAIGSETGVAVGPTVGRETVATAEPPRPSLTATPAPLPDPTARVLDFYRLLQQADYDAISLILSAHMRQAVPWDPDQLRQRTPSGQLTVLRAEVVQPELSQRDATVAVEVLEQVAPPLTTQRRYVGTWHLVRGPSGWLLDEPDIHIE
jgi:CheY-like chemotaxis protein